MPGSNLRLDYMSPNIQVCELVIKHGKSRAFVFIRGISGDLTRQLLNVELQFMENIV